ncbi:MAG: hypothetical protein LLG40_08320 [Deltaproteobacteria bacterium]|nr:hypothetical protein [Deltaproteobacteria bacterium]
MKKLRLILLSLMLVMAFSVSASAVDVKISGEYYAAGMYLSNTNVNDRYYEHKDKRINPDQSTAFFYQRLRVGADFVVSPSLKLVTRFDTMERIWGGARSESSTTLAADSYGTAAENENIAVDWAYINYVSPVGKFDIGIMNDGSTGTIFGNSYAPKPRIKYSYSKDAFTLNLAYTKEKDQSRSAVATGTSFTDGDNNKYGIEGVYAWKDGKAGLQINYYDYAEKRPASDNYNRTYLLFTPYAIAKIGPVALQAEFNYATGDYKKYDRPDSNPSHIDTKVRSISAYVDATATFDPVFLGATAAYVSGDDPETGDINEGALNGGRDWNPCLIMFNYYDVANWTGTIYGYDGTQVTGPMTNAIFVQGRVGVKPVPELKAMLSVSYATADEKPVGYDGNYGWEVDLTGTYKITNNLSYMLGIGYLFTGDYFKGDNIGVDVNNDYIVMNKLTLTF